MRKILLLTLIALFVTVNGAKANDWVPRNEGDFWVYTDGKRSDVTFAAGQWTLFSEFAGLGRMWVWASDTTNRIWLWNEVQFGVIDFDAPEGTGYQLNFAPCNIGVIRLESRGAPVMVPGGNFTDTIKFELQASCPDEGVVTVYFARNVGVVRWDEQAPGGGRRVIEMVRSLSGGESVPDEAGTTAKGIFPLLKLEIAPLIPGSSDPPLPATVRADIQIDNKSADTRTFEFPTTQRYEIEAKDGLGNVVARWSDGQAFPAVPETVTLGPGESLKVGDDLTLADGSGMSLPLGTYGLCIRLTDSTQRWSASAELEICEAPSTE